MDILIENNLPVASSCLGEGVCSKCVMEVTPKGVPTELEIKTMIRNKRDLDQRLCCQIFITEDLTVKAGYW